MNKVLRTILSGVGLAAIGLSMAACGSGDAATPKSDPSAPLATIAGVRGQTTAVALDSGFTSALTTLKLTPGVVGTAKLTDGSLIFPITGGNVKYYSPDGPVQPFVQGDLRHDGSGISLTGGGIKVELTNFDIDPGAGELYGDVTANGKAVVSHAYLFELDGTTLKGLRTAGDTAILEGTTVKMSADAAALLDKTYGTDAVKEGLVIGVAKIILDTK
jgi:hypothetical protein